MRTFVLVLHNIRSVHNVGSIYRTADAALGHSPTGEAGVPQIFLTGYTPAPIDRFGRERKDFTKVSLGAEKTVAWEQVKTLAAAIKKLRKENYFIAALEQSPNSISLFDFHPPLSGGLTLEHRSVALVFGNEIRGLSKSALAQCDTILEIPMHGSKESLNVAVATGVAIFTLLNQSN